MHMCISVFVFAYMFMCVNMCIRICLCVCVYLLYESSNSSKKFMGPTTPRPGEPLRVGDPKREG